MMETIDTVMSTLEDAAPVKDNLYELILERVRLRARRRILWLRKIWFEKNSTDLDQGTYNFHSEVDTCLDNRDTREAELKWYKETDAARHLNEAIRATESLIKQNTSSRLAKLVRLFELSDAEWDVVQVCLAVVLDPNFERVFAYLQDHKARSFVTAQLVSRLFAHETWVTFHAGSPLAIYELVRETHIIKGEMARLELDPFVRNWLMEIPATDETIASLSTLLPVRTPLTHWPVKETAHMICQLLIRRKEDLVRVFIAGQEGSGRRTFAAVVCARLQLGVLSVNSSQIQPQEWSHTYLCAQRHARLDHLALLWHGDVAINNHWPSHLVAADIQFVVGEVEQSCIAQEGIIDVRVELPPLPPADACAIWKKMMRHSLYWPEGALEELIRRHQVTIGEIVSVSKKGARTIAEATEALRSTGRMRLGYLARRMHSDFSWDDLVISAGLRKSLSDFYFEATERHALWEQPAARRLFPQGRGLVALFSGSPGTGKTMAAQVIANSLQYDLFRIDLSSLVSKYIGETAKNIERILSRAKRMNVVLLFDEADALFGKRTDIKDSHDRYANTDTNYLLQAIEEYPGMVILASNRKANMDAGFLRRLRYVLEFPKPDMQQRLQLWRLVVAELYGNEKANAMRVQLEQLSSLMELTGAQIKAAVLSALFMARNEKKDLSIVHLLAGVERELAKEMKGLGRTAQDMMKQTQVN
jgi:hypothetical protein